MRKQLTVNVLAPDFELKDTQGETVRLADELGRGLVVLVVTRGFL